ncbi:MAG: glycosyltransferase 4 family protein [Nanoarchaeota archaeon]
MENSQILFLFMGIFMLTWLIVPFWIKRALKAELTGKDIHKTDQRIVAEMGGVTVLFGFIVGVMSYIAMRIFLFNANTNITSTLAILTAVLLAGVIGIIDDILGWKIGLKQWQKPLLTLLVAAPIMAVNAGTRIMHLPFLGKMDLGMVYPLLIIPAFILVGTNGFNMLAGYNGLEAGQGIIILSTLAYFSYITGSPWLTVIALCMVFALLAFWLFNRYPAKIFPGDTLTYAVGSLAAAMAIVANIEKTFIILFIPYIIEFFLKLRGRFKKESFAQVKEDGTLIPRYDKIYGLENLMVKILNKLNIKATERKVVYSLHLLQIICVFLAFII